MRLPKIVFSLSGFLLVALSPPLLADPPIQPEVKKVTPGKFIRLRQDDDGQPVALQTATARYVPASGEGNLVVDLIGVVHVGEKSYYQKLNKQFEQYDVLLYELVAQQGARPPKGGGKLDNPIAILQQVMKIGLGLDSQMEHIDYSKKNFVHADLSPDQMLKAIKDRGEDGITLFLSLAADLMRTQNLRELEKQKNPNKKELELDIAGLLNDPEAQIKIKKLFAQQLVEQASPEGGLGRTVATILVTDRNEAALKVFQKELANGKKKIAIFYGAAHMPDFEKRLRDDFGLKRQSEQWLTAWDLTRQKSDVEMMLDLIKLLSK